VSAPASSSVSIVAADLSDAAHARAIVKLLAEYALDPMGGGVELDPTVLARVVPGLRAHPACRIWLAFDGDDAVGVAICFIGYSTWSAKPLINIHDIAVSRAARGRGVGRAIMAAVEAAARAMGCCKITLEVRDDNIVARGLYRELGYSQAHAGPANAAMEFWNKPLD
jgi:ribosomal protein S18 acetylase RimI-like enzyme